MILLRALALRCQNVHSLSRIVQRFPLSQNCRSLQTKSHNQFAPRKSLTLETLQKYSRCTFYTTPPRNNPLVSLVLRQVGKVASILLGRAVRRWWVKRSASEKLRFREFVFRHKWKLASPFIALLAVIVMYYYTHIEQSPITNRKRFVAFTQKQFEVLSKLEFEANVHAYKDHLLSQNDPLTLRVGSVVKEILTKNKDMPMIPDHQWSVSVIREDNNVNAFVLPSGQIFVFTGLLKICDNDDQLGVVLAHEISHAILLHGLEMMSHAHIVDMIFIAVLGVLWMLLPTDLIAVIGTALSRIIMKIALDAPYSRMLESEADEVGLELAAKACFDVREASAFWYKMNIMERAASAIPQVDLDVEFLATHPSHENRSAKLDSLMEKALSTRKTCGCRELPKIDPRERVKAEQDEIVKKIQSKNYEGVLRIGEL